MAIDKQTRAEILRLYFAEKWKIGTIARQLGVHHGTVERAVAASGAPVRAKQRRASKIDPFWPFIRQTLAAWPRLPSSRLYRMAVERGYRGSQSHFRHMIAPERPRLVAEAYLRLKVLPGEQAQVDWAHFGKVRIGRAERPLMGFVMVLGHSRRIFLRFCLNALPKLTHHAPPIVIRQFRHFLPGTGVFPVVVIGRTRDDGGIGSGAAAGC